MTTWTADTPTTATWTIKRPIDWDILFEFTSGSPYGLLLVITRPYTETVYETSVFTESSPTSAAWTVMTPS